MTPTYAYLDANGWVRQWSLESRPVTSETGEIGPYLAASIEGLTLDLLPDGFVMARNLRKVNGIYTDMTPGPQPSATSEIQQLGDVLVWVETATLEQAQIEAISSIDAFADAARLAVVGDAARIKEYERAQAGAEAYRDAGFTGEVPPAVASWAYAKRRSEWTAQQAAEDILAASSRWYAALDEIRALRLDAKECTRFAETNEEVVAIAATFRATLTATMEGV